MTKMSITYRAIKYIDPVLTGYNVVTESVDLEHVGRDEIIVKTAYAALNPVDLVLAIAFGSFNYFKKQYTIGREFSGVVAAVGEDVVGFRAGDRVAGLITKLPQSEGPVSEYIKFHKGLFSMAKVPEDVSLKDAATMPLSYNTVHKIVEDFHPIGPDTKVLLLGGGTMAGMLALQLLRNTKNVRNLVSVNSSKTDIVLRKLGLAVHTVNYDKVSTTEAVQDHIKTVFEGDKFDVIIDTVGNSEFLDNIKDYLKLNNQSHYITIVGDAVLGYNDSWLKQANGVRRTLYRVLANKLFNQGFNYKYILTDTNPNRFAEGLHYISTGKVKTLVDSTFPIADTKMAIDRLSTHHAKGKVLIELHSDLK